MEISFNSLARTSSPRLHGRNRFSRSSRQPSRRSWLSQLPSNVDIPSNSKHDNISFGMDTTHFCENPTNTKDALIAQCPIVVFKASTVLQSIGIIASRILLPSADTQGETRERTYCPTTWNYAYGYHTPTEYSDALFEKGAPAVLAHECVLSVIAQMSNKNSRHAQCANAHSPSAAVSQA